MNPVAPFETFPALEMPLYSHAFTHRIPGLEVGVERGEALRRLEPSYSGVRALLGFSDHASCEQVHEGEIAVIPATGKPSTLNTFHLAPISGVDGLITDRPGICLEIVVADCCAVYLVDPVGGCIGLVHSGRKGTELGIVPAAIEKMRSFFGTNPADLLVQLSPCIRPPHYETDFAAQIVEQCRAAGAEKIFDGRANTGADLRRYYSYRVEKGKTGRMLALLGINSPSLK